MTRATLSIVTLLIAGAGCKNHQTEAAPAVAAAPPIAMPAQPAPAPAQPAPAQPATAQPAATVTAPSAAANVPVIAARIAIGGQVDGTVEKGHPVIHSVTIQGEQTKFQLEVFLKKNGSTNCGYVTVEVTWLDRDDAVVTTGSLDSSRVDDWAKSTWPSKLAPGDYKLKLTSRSDCGMSPYRIRLSATQG